MKKLFLTIMAVFAMTAAFAQDNAQENVQAKCDSVRVYASLNLPTNFSSNPQIDLGDGNLVGFRTEDGRKAKSFVAAMNYLSVHGWRVECTFTKREDESYIIMSKMFSRQEAEAISTSGLK